MSAAHEDMSREHPVSYSSNRSFGLVMTGFFALVTFAPLLRGNPIRAWTAPIAALFLILTACAADKLAPFNRLWFKLGLLLGSVTSPVFLAIFYYLILTPLALFMRLTGKDFLRLRREPSMGSYWILREPLEPSSFRRQF